MKKLTTREGIAVAAAIVTVGVLLFGNSFLTFINGTNQTEQTNNMNLPQTGFQTEELSPGTGEGAVSGDTITVHYVGRLSDGRVFDSSLDRNQPFSFVLGSGSVIRGWEEGMAGMKVGEKRRLTIAPDYGYGPNDYGPIPGNSVLIFDIELLDLAKTSI
ncbi:MAG: FKBP-type peptidyl-prolyl cis-trans isomerase [Parcubacteria group bacterium]